MPPRNISLHPLREDPPEYQVVDEDPQRDLVAHQLALYGDPKLWWPIDAVALIDELGSGKAIDTTIAEILIAIDENTKATAKQRNGSPYTISCRRLATMVLPSHNTVARGLNEMQDELGLITMTRSPRYGRIVELTFKGLALANRCRRPKARHLPKDRLAQSQSTIGRTFNFLRDAGLTALEAGAIMGRTVRGALRQERLQTGRGQLGYINREVYAQAHGLVDVKAAQITRRHEESWVEWTSKQIIAELRAKQAVSKSCDSSPGDAASAVADTLLRGGAGSVPPQPFSYLWCSSPPDPLERSRCAA